MEWKAIISILLLVWGWSASMRARELALEHARRGCRELELLLLDDTVSLRSMGLGRNGLGRLCFRRQYGFQYTRDRLHRLEGMVILVGDDLEALVLDAPRGPFSGGRG